MSSGDSILVVGGGIAGLASAQLLKRKFPGKEIIVAEQSADIGGLLGCFDYGAYGIFDRGMHWYTETRVPAVDEIFLDLLPHDQLHVLKGNKRDITGLYYRGRLQMNSQYPDLRSLPSNQYRACLADFFDNLRRPAEHGPITSLHDFSRRHFGQLIAETVISPIAERIHGAPADELDVLARALPLLDRVILFDEQLCRELMNSELLRARIAFPEQRRLPLNFSSGRRSYYPKSYGIHRMIDALADRLRSEGVKIITGARITGLKRKRQAITEALIEFGGKKRSLELKYLVWTASSFPLAALLGLHFRPGLARVRRTVVVSALLKSAPRTEDLYCFFCADGPHVTYRVTNFSAFCPNSVRGGTYPISIELLVDPPSPTAATPDYAAQAISEIELFGIISNRSDVVFARAELLPGGFPGATRQNMLTVDALRNTLEAENFVNLVRTGILAEPQLFFQHEILCDANGKISAL